MPRSRLGRHFCRRLRSLLQPPSPVSFETGSFSRELYVPFRVRATNDLPLATSLKQPCDHLREAKERLPWSSVPLRGISWQRPLTTEVTQLRPDAPSVAFLAPSTVYSATSLAGLFHPATTSRVRSSGVCPSPWSLCRLSPSVSLVPVRTQAPAVARSSTQAPELQGVAPHEECGGSRPAVKPIATPLPS